MSSISGYPSEQVAVRGEWMIETVTGPVPMSQLGLSLEHEHVLVDFVGADMVSPERYDADEVFEVVRPHLEIAARNGVKALFECTPAYIGRDPALLRRLSEATGIRLITNTGLYGAADDKFLPDYAYKESAEQLAARWIAEARDGIEGTGIKPGFIKSAVDRDPELSDIDRKLMEAAALAHRETGLTIAVHTGSGPGLEIIRILRERGTDPEAFIWVHAQGAANEAILEAARAGAWISLDGIRPESLERHLDALLMLKDHGLLGRALLSHDAGWFDPAKPGGGNFRGYEMIFAEFLPLLREHGFTAGEIAQIMARNVALAFGVRPRLLHTGEQAELRPFIERLQPAPRAGGFRRDGYWVWCGSVIRGDDGRYHMFASMWTKEVSFSPNWVTNSRIVRAVSDTAEGPYEYVEDVLPPREGDWWDAKMTHNPTIHRHGDDFLLFYTGSNYNAEIPTGESPPMVSREDPLRFEARSNQRIGLAVAKSPEGPWQRPDEPILDVRPDKWDSLLTTNPAPYVRDDGSVLLLYKSALHDRAPLLYGIAGADHWAGTYERLQDDYIRWTDDPDLSYEDAYVWFEHGRLNAVFKDMKDRLVGEYHAGGYGWSLNGVDWTLGEPPKAYSRHVLWDDGVVCEMGCLERPQILMQEGRSTHLICATADGPGGFHKAEYTWSTVIPLGAW